jgi:hypothetical protein
VAKIASDTEIAWIASAERERQEKRRWDDGAAARAREEQTWREHKAAAELEAKRVADAKDQEAKAVEEQITNKRQQLRGYTFGSALPHTISVENRYRTRREMWT